MEKDDDFGDRQVLASFCSTYLGKPTPMSSQVLSIIFGKNRNLATSMQA